MGGHPLGDPEEELRPRGRDRRRLAGPPAYARARETDGPAVVLTFRSQGIELDALREAEAPYSSPCGSRTSPA